MKKEYCIMPPNPCYETERRPGLHRHEIFYGGARRQLSIKYGLVVFLTPEMHNESKRGVHFDNGFDTRLKQLAQAVAMNYYGWSKEEFMQIFYKNYL